MLQDRREIILKAAIATLREHGFSGFTQPRVAKRADVRQSHLTYYFPTRLALLEGVARLAVDGQLAALQSIVDLPSVSAVIKNITAMIGRHENTRVLMALAQAADEEPSLRSLFRELADGIVSRLRQLLENLHLDATEEQVNLIHSLSVGLAVVDLATQRPHSKRRVEAILETLFATLACRPSLHGTIPSSSAEN
jgi:AcrR family transcriptional regulator